MPQLGQYSAEPPVTLSGLPTEVQRVILTGLDVYSLARSAQTHAAWRALVRCVAEAHVRAKRQVDALSDCPCWLRCYASMCELEAAVGPRPSRTWRHENVRLQHASARSRGDTFSRETFGVGGALSIEEEQRYSARELRLKRAAGWTREQALAYCRFCGTTDELHHSLHSRSSSYAATWHTLMSILFARSVRPMKLRSDPQDVDKGFSALLTRLEAVTTALDGIDSAHEACDSDDSETALEAADSLTHPARLYSGLTCDEGLAEDAEDDTWHPDRLTRLGIGGRFRTRRLAEAHEPSGAVLRERGWHAFKPDEGLEALDEREVEWQRQETDVVCFEQGPPSASGFHALVRGDRHASVEDTYHLPPFAIVEIVGIDEAGTWSEPAALGHSVAVHCRRFVVRVSFGC